MGEFDRFFEAATGFRPYPYQRKLAAEAVQSRLIRVPTGAGKTAAAIVAWLWRRKVDPDKTPRRLVYCLPMRVLVEQTRDKAKEWTAKVAPDVQVFTLMGGELDEDWELYPDRPAILVGTQDMLLSRALNRGYAMSRYRWPVHFGLLNNDCLWVCDEIQLMGSGLATTAQLEAFRQPDYFGSFGPGATWWMSATLDPAALGTVDFSQHVDRLPKLEPTEADLEEERLSKRLHSLKKLERAPDMCRSPSGLAEFVSRNHRAGSQSLIIVNRVGRACEVFDALRGLSDAGDLAADVLLLHSRFRPPERRAWIDRLQSPLGKEGRIVVATQVVEAGVDLSSALLVTDLAPYSSLVQRFGRCNRGGELERAAMYWVDRPLDRRRDEWKEESEQDEKQRTEVARPYEWRELNAAEGMLAHLRSASPQDLLPAEQSRPAAHVLRRRDMLDLFDTTRDLSGYDIDISRFLRDGEDRDLQVAWRDLDHAAPGRETPAVQRDELCPVPIGEFAAFLGKPGKSKWRRVGWAWSALDGRWEEVGTEELRPGMVVLLDSTHGGYRPERGWDAGSQQSVPPVLVADLTQPDEGDEDDPGSSKGYWQTLEAHSTEVITALSAVAEALSNVGLDVYRRGLLTAALHHDVGKAHPVFQETMRRCPHPPPPAFVLAKSPFRSKHSRPHFRHELASGLALLQLGASDLVSYLAACHHGRVRLCVRAVPGENRPADPAVKFARGVWDADRLPALNLGDAQVREVQLDLDPMFLGSPLESRSWLERMLELREQVGVFRLAYLESLIRLSDDRASAAPKEVLEWPSA